MPDHQDTSDGLEVIAASDRREAIEVTDFREAIAVIDRREAIRRVGVLLGGLTLVGGSTLLTACERERPPVAAGAPIGKFTSNDIVFLDEIADTILPETKTPGAKAAKTGAFMALMVTDAYTESDQKIFRDGMRALNDASVKANNASFVSATPQQRLALLEALDREQKAHSDAREAAKRKSPTRPDTAKTDESGKAERFLPDQRKEAAPVRTSARLRRSRTTRRHTTSE